MEVEEKEFAQYRFEGDGDNGHHRYRPDADVVRAANPALAPSDVDTYQHASSYIDTIIAATNASTEYYLPDFNVHRHGGNDDASPHGDDQNGIGNANESSDRASRSDADRRDR